MNKVKDHYQLGDLIRNCAIGRQMVLSNAILRFKNEGLYFKCDEMEILFPFELEEDIS